MLPVLNIGPLVLRLPGLLILLGLWLATYLVDREATRRSTSGSDINSMLFFALLGGLVGARLGYALHYLDIYLANPLALLSLSAGTLAPLEGVVVGGIVALVYGQRKRLPLWTTLDVLSPALGLFAVFVGLAHFSSGDAFGAESQVPWAIELWGASRHPTQVYETLLAGLILGIVLRLRTSDAFPGFLFLAWLALSAQSRLFLEAFRGDSVIILGNLRQAQLVSLLVLLLALGSLHILARRHSTGSPYPASN
jgi:prolipoprotein diacylglyceryl transferase